MALSSVWDQCKRNLLTFGYVRSLFNQTPNAIINVILTYYDDMKYWTITSGKQMNRFFDCKCAEIMYGPTFIMKDIKFQCILAPNGYEEDHKGRTALILSVSKLPSNVQYVYVYFILFCNETKYEHKVTRILAENAQNEQQERHKWRSKFPWATNAVNRSDLKGFDSLTFGYYVDIIHIVYDVNDETMDTLNDAERESITYGFIPSIAHVESRIVKEKIVHMIMEYQGRSYWSKGIEISSSYNYEWTVNGDRLKQMQNCHFGQHFYSSNFDKNNWCLYLSPAGWTKGNNNMFSFQLKMLRMPYKLLAIYVKFKLETDFHDINIKKAKIFRYRDCRSGWQFEEKNIPFDDFKVLDAITIKLELEILAGFDIKTRRRIKKHQWKRYGII